MAKVIRYRFLSCEVNHGTEENPEIEQVFVRKSIVCPTQDAFDANYLVAEGEAFGEITVEDDGVPEPEAPVSGEERLAAVETKIAAMEAAYTEGVQEA